ncbi:MAG: signal peptidase II [Verrucomicrobiota bacterium]|nr:signal peptidase II [Verrucomicrobiota bacterium]
MPEESQPESSLPLFQEKKLLGVGLVIFLFDQATKLLAVRHFKTPDPIDGGMEVIQGFLNFTYRLNTGAAWSIFEGRNTILALVAVLALAGLLYYRRHFDNGTATGKLALGLLVGGVLGNLVDRLIHNGVVDFIDFYIQRANGTYWHWPAFNIADAAICTGVGLLFVMAWRTENVEDETPAANG